MFPFRNILFPTDFSPNSQAALKYAAAFARSGHGRVVVLNVQGAKVPENILQLSESDFAEQSKQWLRQLYSDANTLLADTVFNGVDVELIFVDGEEPAAIAQAALDHEIDLMTVVMRGGRKRFSRAFGGSIAEEIVAESPCAVLAVRPPQRDFVDERHDLRLNRILLATNFRPSSVAATQLATQIANHMNAELHAVYVIGDYFDQISSLFPEGGLAALTRLRSSVDERMTQLARNDGTRGAVTHVAEGRPYEEIVRLAVRLEADLIVIGTAVHNALFGGAPVLGSDIERVIRNAPCPVLCVPAAKVLTPLPAFVTQAVTT
jgi:nucleotide-binding universal stress UspA family protein